METGDVMKISGITTDYLPEVAQRLQPYLLLTRWKLCWICGQYKCISATGVVQNSPIWRKTIVDCLACGQIPPSALGHMTWLSKNFRSFSSCSLATSLPLSLPQRVQIHRQIFMWSTFFLLFSYERAIRAPQPALTTDLSSITIFLIFPSPT